MSRSSASGLAGLNRAGLVAALVGGAACQAIEPIDWIEPSCDETVYALVSTTDQAPSGLRAEAFLASVVGPRSTTLDYLGPPEEGVYVELARPLDADATTLTLEFVPDETGVRWVEAERVDPDDLDPDETLPCDSRFEIDGTLAFSTDDGVFAELLETTLWAPVDASGAIDYAAVPLSFEPGGLAGSFEVAAINPEYPTRVFHELWVEFPLEPGAEPRGYVGGVAEYDLLDAYVLGVFHVALFGGYVLD